MATCSPVSRHDPVIQRSFCYEHIILSHLLRYRIAALAQCALKSDGRTVERGTISTRWEVRTEVRYHDHWIVPLAIVHAVHHPL